MGVTRMEDTCLQGLEEETNGKRPLSRPRHRQKGNVKVDLKETWLEVVGFIDNTQNMNNCRAVVNMVMKVSVA